MLATCDIMDTIGVFYTTEFLLTRGMTMPMQLIKCPLCGNTDMLIKVDDAGNGSWRCGCCDSNFTERLAKREYEKLEAAIEAGIASIGSVVSEALKQERERKYDNLRSMLINKVKAPYVDSKAIVEICRDILAIVPDDFLADFLEVANSAAHDEVAEYIKRIDVEENAVYMELVLDFIIRSLTEKYIVPTAALLDRCARIFTPVKKKEYFTRFEQEAQRVQEGLYSLAHQRDVFLAYSGKDLTEVIRILEYVEYNGFTCFAAFRNLQHGRDAVAKYEEALKTAIDHCTVFLFVSSVNSRSFYCDAFSKEMVYVRDSEMKKHSECRTYAQIPSKYKKLRIEYRLDNHPTRATDRDMRDFFSGLTYVEDLDTLIDRLAECLSPTNITYIDEEPMFSEDEIKRRVEEELRKRAEEESRAKAEAKSEATTKKAKLNFSNGYYEGEVKNGQANGNGTFYYTSGDRYEGEWTNDKRNGKGTFHWANGNHYEGEWKNGKRNGKGTYYWADGERYEGEWVDGARSGYGVDYYTNGNRYEGEYKNDKRNGKGTCYYANGRYEGEWVDGLSHGYGIYYFADGGRYEGEYKNDKRNGKGTRYYASGDRYEGEWVDGLFHGYGIYYFADGRRYEGEYKNDKRNGKGTYYWADGERYEGEWVDGARSGYGVDYYTNGGRYEGEYKNDKRNGKGTFYWPDGGRYEGEWRDNKRNGKGTLYWADGERYEGNWANDKRNGYGINYYADGRRYEGEWVDDGFHGHGTYYAKKGTFEGDWIDCDNAENVTKTDAKGRKTYGRYVNDEFEESSNKRFGSIFGSKKK